MYLLFRYLQVNGYWISNSLQWDQVTKLDLFIFSFKAQESQRRILAEDNLLRREKYLKYDSLQKGPKAKPKIVCGTLYK